MLVRKWRDGAGAGLTMRMEPTVQIVGEEPALLEALVLAFKEQGFRVVEAADAAEGWRCFRREAPDLVLSELGRARLPAGIELLLRIRRASRTPVVLFATESEGGVEDAVRAVKCGADDFVVAPEVELAPRLVRVARHLTRPAPGDAAAARQLLQGQLPGSSPAIGRVRERIIALAPLCERVLVTGEPGSGRETAARALHALATPERPFVALCAAALPHLPTPPRQGSIYLRDVEQLAPMLQRAWLEQLESGARDGRFGARWVVGAEPALVARARAGMAPFDPTLARHLARFELALPSLRERPEDVPHIARVLVERAGARLGRRTRLSDEAAHRLRLEVWTGNLTELAGVIEKLVAFSSGARIEQSEVEEVIGDLRLSVESLRDYQALAERERLLEALAETGGNVSRTATMLGRSRTTIYRMAERNGVRLRRRG